MVKAIIKYFIGYIKCKLCRIRAGKNCYLGINVKCINNGTINFGDRVKIRPGTNMYVNSESVLTIGNNSEIGQDSTIACQCEVQIGEGVLTGPHVFIADHNHEYRDVDRPIFLQGVSMDSNAAVLIDDETWLGTNVCIVGKVHIGKHCVIGANSVVTKDIPDYCVAAGIPAKIIKRYNFLTQKWEHVSE